MSFFFIKANNYHYDITYLTILHNNKERFIGFVMSRFIP